MHKQNQHIERIARSLARAAIIRANKLTKKEKIRKILKPLRVRLSIAGLVALIVIAEFTPILDVFVAQKVQAFEDPQSLLPKTSQAMADKLTFNAAKQTYTFNEGYTPQSDSSLKRGGPKITATANVDARKGLSVIDPTNQLQFGLKPKFELKAGEKKDNRVVYPLINGSGWLVYTMEAGQVKEDILLSHATKNKMELKYDLELGDSLEARMQDNGDIGVFGSDSPVVGNVSTGSDKDADLLQKARKATKKDKLIFVIPAPVIKESNVKESSVKAHYEVEGTVLTLKVEGLKKATYPLTIDPSVYVTSASQFMYGNNDSNIDFNTSSELIQKGQITGARIPSWQTNGTSLNGNIKAAGTTVAGGYVYMVGGSDGSSRLNTVYWGKFDPSGTSITSPTPSSSSGVCANFCTNSQYNLPQARSNLAVTTYNGYLYAIGGEGTGCGTNLACNTVYKSKIGANGEPNAWTAVSAMSTERKNTSAVAYNNRIYVAGGQTNSSLNGTQSVQSAAINPDGTLSTWTGVTNLSTATYGMTLLQYNGYLYAVAGASGATTLYNVDYAKINSDGTLDIWVQTVSSTAIRRGTLGGSFATIYGGYMYLAGGCSAMTTTSCTTALNDFNLASINADGSLTSFTTLPSITQTRTAYSLVSWRGAIYAIGGCSASGACGTPINTITYGVINSDGDVSNKFSGTTLPATGTGSGRGGRMAGGVVINNGYIYNIGGCITNNCKNDSLNTSYASINSDGTIGSWTTQTNTGLVGSLAMGVTVHNNVIYAVGGGTGGNFNSSMSRVSINANGSLSGNWSVTGNVLSGSFGYPFVFARTIPSNNTQSYLYMVGGCTGSAIGCTGYTAVTRRCTVTTSTGALVGGSCTSSGMLQLNAATGISGGAVYGNYIYLAGGANSLSGGNVSATGSTCTADPGACGGQTDIIQYAMINSSGNITLNDGSTTTGGWHIASTRLYEVRRRTTAFAANGYFYVVAGHDGAAGVTLQDVLRGKIDINTGDVTMDATPLVTGITERWDLRAAQANGIIYVLGGCTAGPPPADCGATPGTEGSNSSSDGMNGIVEYLQIYNNGTGSPVSYTAQSPVTAPADRFGASATINDGYIYLAGGCTSATDCTTYTNNVSYAPINPDGTITTANWVTSGSIPATRAFGCLVTIGGTLYYLGGQNATAGASSAYNTVYYSDIGGSGAPGTWNTASNALSTARSSASCATYNNRIYVSGGTTAAPAYQNTVLISPSLPTGGNIASAWSSSANTFTGTRSGHSTIAYGNNLYVIGGFDGTNYLMDVQYALINSNGTIGTWKYGTPLPQAIRQADAFAANGFLYIFGGRSAATTCTSNTYVAPINANPIISKVVQENPSAIGTWSQTSVAYSGNRYGVAAAYDSGRAYLIGGMCNGTLTNTNRVVYGTLQAQPQISRYSTMVDADGDVYPSKFLFNGIDSGIGARWLLSYSSSKSSINTWGQSTKHGVITLGTPGPYVAKDGAGANSLSARYYYLSLIIDASQSFGFPEDSSRGPTIDDMTLQLSADPSKRLRNGKTFIGGEQQPLDTPF